MHSFLLSDWTTTRGPAIAAGSQITQDEIGWLDLAPFQDVVIYLDCRSITGGGNVTFSFETAPTKDDPRDTNGNPTFFQPVMSVAIATAGTTVLRGLMTTATTPLARYLRWRVTGPAAVVWDATFRVVVAANAPGM